MMSTEIKYYSNESEKSMDIETIKKDFLFTIDEEFVVHDIKVIEGEKGLFIAMPSRRAGDGEYRDIAHPINSDMRDRLQSEILAKYEEAVKESRENETAEE